MVTSLDWLIVAFASILALLGFRQGFIVGALSFGGFLLGAFVGTRLGPLLLPQGSDSPYAPAFGLLGALLAGALLATGFEGFGFRLRRGLVMPGLGVLDGILGAALGVAVGLGIVWIAAAVAAQAPGESQLRADIQRSVILRELNELLPPSGPILGALARLDPLPSITGPSPGVAAPEPRLVGDAAVRSAAHDVVRVIGTACGLAIEGSGWSAGNDLVVTNAHVVAGEDDTEVEVGGETPAMPARVLAFDRHDDLAVLEVPGLGLPALGVREDPPSGTAGVIAGYPENGPLDLVPGRIGRTQDVLTEDAYGNGPVTRLLTPLRGRVRPGNSGGPMLDSRGRVLTTVFAATVSGSSHGGYGVANASLGAVLRAAGERAADGVTVSTEGCTSG
ncbi:MAG TPA: MarP family serine protease [Solirubrobacteraceae bacterium]|nr:MarP family serine protease [Solirubrobacteraceae bacterium]